MCISRYRDVRFYVLFSDQRVTNGFRINQIFLRRKTCSPIVIKLHGRKIMWSRVNSYEYTLITYMSFKRFVLKNLRSLA